VRYVVDYNAVQPDGEIRNPGQRDVESPVPLDGYDESGHAYKFAATLVEAQVVLRDGDRIVVTDIRPVP
jgi:hypothetical protein